MKLLFSLAISIIVLNLTALCTASQVTYSFEEFERGDIILDALPGVYIDGNLKVSDSPSVQLHGDKYIGHPYKGGMATSYIIFDYPTPFVSFLFIETHSYPTDPCVIAYNTDDEEICRFSDPVLWEAEEVTFDEEEDIDYLKIIGFTGYWFLDKLSFNIPCNTD